jgi:plasmid stabilization system protein ParE
VVVRRSDRFSEELKSIVTYIAKDKKHAAKEFAKYLKIDIDTLPDNPRRCRKSIHFEDDNIRDMIFMGYVIVYIIDEQKQEILLLGIIKQNLW